MVPLVIVLDDVLYSYAERCMMAGEAPLFQDHGSAELSISLTGPREHKRIGRRGFNFDCVIRYRVREDAVDAGTFAKSKRNPVKTQHLYKGLVPIE